jgi:alpha/beta superfamily hydrolase
MGPSTVLPAQRDAVELHTQDGLRLVGELAQPENGSSVATLVTLHPLPTAGGFMDSHVLRKASYRLPALAGINVLRFNTRGTCSPAGCSEGAFDEARGEGHDLRAALDHVRALGLPNIWLLGWSFGTDVTLKHGLLPGVEGAVLLSPPLRFTTDDELDDWARDGRPLTALVPEKDDFLQPEEARRRFARVPHAEVIGVDGAVHLWVGERQVRQALDSIVARVAPSAGPLDWSVTS